jgi:peptide/nickel transport system permease protein
VAVSESLALSVAEPVPRRGHLGITFWVAVVWVVVLSLAALFAAWLPLADPSEMDFLERRALPSIVHWLGTDGLGRDMASRLVYGAQTSLSVGLVAPMIGLLFGGSAGMLAGYFRGWFDRLVVGGVDVVLAFPPLVLALAVTAYLGQSVLNLTLILGALGIPAFARVARAATLVFAQREFVTAARALGATHSRILVNELLPNVALPLAAFFLVAVAVTIVAESALSFLGLGVPPPRPSWGSMIGEGRESLDHAAWLAFLPAVMMFITVLAFNLIGDTLRAAADPRRGPS